jgi:hypothetical protein
MLPSSPSILRTPRHSPCPRRSDNGTVVSFPPNTMEQPFDKMLQVSKCFDTLDEESISNKKPSKSPKPTWQDFILQSPLDWKVQKRKKKVCGDKYTAKLKKASNDCKSWEELCNTNKQREELAKLYLKERDHSLGQVLYLQRQVADLTKERDDLLQALDATKKDDVPSDPRPRLSFQYMISKTRRTPIPPRS